MYTNLILHIENKVAHVKIDNPPANALSTGMIDSLSRCLQDLANREDVKVITIMGNGKFFVAGADIKEFQTAFGDCQKGKEMAVAAQQLFDNIEGMHKPVIAAINGACLGGGMELAMSCHLRIAAHEAQLGLPELKLGLIPGYGGTQRLPRITNKAKALELILTSDFIKGEEAEKIGLVNKAVPLSELESTVKALSEKIANEKSAVSVSYALRAVSKGLDGSLSDGLKLEANLFGELFATADMKEGITAFIEKRAAKFQDK